jgi:hypothetical protein
MRFDRRLVGWGLFFIILGLVPLGVRAGVLDVDLVGRWPRLWPVLLIGWGVGLVLRGTPAAWTGGALTATALAIMGGGAIATGLGNLSTLSGCGGGNGEPFESQQGPVGSTGSVDIEFDCGTLDVSAADGPGWQVTGSDPGGSGPSVTTTADGVHIQPGPERGDSFFNFSQGHSTWDVSVPRSPSLRLGATLNAGQGTVDLTGATLAGLDVTVNAGSMRVSAAEATPNPGTALDVTVNAGSAAIDAPAYSGTLSASLNAGSLDLCLPAGAAVRVSWSGALASNDLDRLGLVKVDDHTWTTQQFDAAKDHVELRVSANAGRFGLSMGGACGA